MTIVVGTLTILVVGLLVTYWFAPTAPQPEPLAEVKATHET